MLACLANDSVSNSDQREKNETLFEEVLGKGMVQSMGHDLEADSNSDLAISLVVDQDDQSRLGTGEMRTDYWDSQRIQLDSGYVGHGSKEFVELFRFEESQALRSGLDSDLGISLVVDQEDQSRSGTGEMRTDLCDSQGVNPDSGCDVQDYEGLAELFRDEESQALKSELDSDLAILLVVDQEDQSRSGTGEMGTDLCDSQGVNPDSGCDVQDYEGFVELFRDEDSEHLNAEMDSSIAISLMVGQEDQSRLGTGEMGTDLCEGQRVNSESEGTDVYVAIARVYSLGKDSYRSGDRGLLVEVKVNERSMVLLIDTGSEVSVLRRESYENLSEVDLDSAHVKLRAVNGSSFPVVGKIKVSLDVMGNGCSSKENFLIADISKSFDVDGILGLDVLKKHSVQVDLEEDKIEYDGVWVSCLGSKDKKQTHVTPTDTGVEKSCDALFSENKETGTVLPVEQAVRCKKVTKEEVEVYKEPKPPWYKLVKCSPSGNIPWVEQLHLKTRLF